METDEHLAVIKEKRVEKSKFSFLICMLRVCLYVLIFNSCLHQLKCAPKPGLKSANPTSGNFQGKKLKSL